MPIRFLKGWKGSHQFLEGLTFFNEDVGFLDVNWEHRAHFQNSVRKRIRQRTISHQQNKSRKQKKKLLPLNQMSQLKLIWTWEEKNKKIKTMWKWRDIQTFRILDFVHLQNRLTVLFPFLTYLSYVFLISAQWPIYVWLWYHFIHSSRICSGQDVHSKHGGHNDSLHWNPLALVEQDRDHWFNKSHIDSLGLCLLILQCVAYFNYQFPVLPNS